MYRRQTAAYRRHGFTFIEVMTATIILGVGIVALLVAVQSGTRVNAAGRRITIAAMLAQEVREWTLKLPFSDPDEADSDNPPGPDGTNPQTFVDDLDDLMDVTYCPPRDGQGSAIADMPQWSQTITLTWRDPSDLSTVVQDGTSDVIHVGVEISYRNQPVLTTGWLATRREDE